MKRNLVKVSFENKTIFVGMDVHQKTWHITIMFDGYVRSFSYIANAKQLAEYIKSEYPGATFKAGYEAGCFGYWIKAQLEEEGIETIVINPGDIPTSPKDSEKKTDKIDSKKIAYSIMHGYVKSIYVPDRESQEHRDLIRQRDELVRKKTRIKNQIKAKLKFYGISYPEEYEDRSKHWSKNFINWLKTIKYETTSGKETMNSMLRELEFLRAEILQITRLIRALSKTEKYAEKNKILLSIPGIGMIASMIILTEIIDIDRFKSKDEFLSYLGLTPTERSSGEKRRIGHMTKRCNHTLRSVLIEASWIAIRRDPAMTMYYNEVYKKIGKTKAIIKVGRKLASRVRYLWKRNEPYVFGIAA